MKNLIVLLTVSALALNVFALPLNADPASQDVTQPHLDEALRAPSRDRDVHSHEPVSRRHGFGEDRMSKDVDDDRTTLDPNPEDPDNTNPVTTIVPSGSGLGNDTTTASTPTTTSSNSTTTSDDTTTPTEATTSTSDKTTTTPKTTTSQKTTETSTTETTPFTTTPVPSTTTSAKPEPSGRSFDGWSFFGGIILALVMVAIAFLGMKYYRARSRNEGTGGSYNRFS